MKQSPPADVTVYYMRDNHTFRRLSLNVEEALVAIREEYANGYTYGSVCSKAVDKLCHSYGNLEAFEPMVRKWYAENL